MSAAPPPWPPGGPPRPRRFADRGGGARAATRPARPRRIGAAGGRARPPAPVGPLLGGAGRARADATGPLAFRHLGVAPTLSRDSPRPAARHAGARQGDYVAAAVAPARSIAQHRTSRSRAGATGACFLRAWPPGGRR
jgi:hypothetical protein